MIPYLLRKEVLSRVWLVGLPLADLLLLGLSALDLRSGASATFAHGMAAAHIGFTVAFAGRAVKWAAAHSAHRFGCRPAASEAAIALLGG